jgi:hypothetical protein
MTVFWDIAPYTRLQSATSQKTVICILVAVRTWNLTLNLCPFRSMRDQVSHSCKETEQVQFCFVQYNLRFWTADRNMMIPALPRDFSAAHHCTLQLHMYTWILYLLWSWICFLDIVGSFEGHLQYDLFCFMQWLSYI